MIKSHKILLFNHHTPLNRLKIRDFDYSSHFKNQTQNLNSLLDTIETDNPDQKFLVSPPLISLYTPSFKPPRSRLNPVKSAARTLILEIFTLLITHTKPPFTNRYHQKPTRAYRLMIDQDQRRSPTSSIK